jgi:hypothetical protein
MNDLPYSTAPTFITIQASDLIKNLKNGQHLLSLE